MIDFRRLPSCQYFPEENFEGFIHFILAWEGISAEHARAVVQNDYDEVCRHYDVVHMRRPLEVESQKDFMLQQMRHIATMRFTVRAKQKETI